MKLQATASNRFRTDDGNSYTPEQVQACMLARQAEATERIAAAMEQANELLLKPAVAAACETKYGTLEMHAVMERNSTAIQVSYSFSNPASAAKFFNDFSNSAKDLVDQANAAEQEGGQQA